MNQEEINMQIVENILNECRQIEEYYLPAIRNEANKVKERNWLSLAYMSEKTKGIKWSVDHIMDQSELINKLGK